MLLTNGLQGTAPQGEAHLLDVERPTAAVRLEGGNLLAERMLCFELVPHLLVSRLFICWAQGSCSVCSCSLHKVYLVVGTLRY